MNQTLIACQSCGRGYPTWALASDICAQCWKANHDNQVTLRRTITQRPDLKERAELVEKLARENAEMREELKRKEP